MTVLKLALVNLVLWMRDAYFPATYAHATWHRLAPFFHLPGRIVWGKETVEVELSPFNDHRDLAAVCAQVSVAAPRLPGGEQLRFQIRGTVGCTGGVRASECCMRSCLSCPELTPAPLGKQPPLNAAGSS